jgi:acyl-CoA synthetase (NDP forming)
VDFKPLFEPRTLAVIGVSLRNDRHPANVIYHKNNLRYPVKVFPVNHRGGTYQSETVYPRVSDVPEPVDLAIIAARAEQVPDILADCIAAKVGGAAVISGGFAETGRRDLQDRVVSLAREADFPLIGPNCLGIYSPRFADCFFLPSERMVKTPPGGVAFISQSGGVLVDLMIKFAAEGIGLSLGVSIGNKALVREVDLLPYLFQDENTRVIAFYVEGFQKNEGREFVQAARNCGKPILVLKGGQSPGGSRAVQSHTASLAGDYATFSAIMSQFGVIEARGELEMISFCQAYSCYHESIQGQIGLITGSGGHGAMAVDACAAHGLNMPGLSAADQQTLRDAMSPAIRDIAATGNPVDLTGSATDDDFVAVATQMFQMKAIDCVLVLLLPYLPGITSDLGARLSQIHRTFNKPLIAYVPHEEKYGMFIEGFEYNDVPVAHSIEGAVHMAEALRRRRPC